MPAALEYKVLGLPKKPIVELEQELNAAARDGYRLVAGMLPGYLILERSIATTPGT